MRWRLGVLAALSVSALGPCGIGVPRARAELMLAAAPPSTLRWQDITVVPRSSFDIRRQGSTEIVSPQRELELSSEMSFVTSRGAMEGVPQLYFTDLGLWRVHAAGTPVSRLRITAAATFLPKQPATLDEPFWQSAALGARIGVTNWAAIGVDASFGKMMRDLGYYGSTAVGFQARRLMKSMFTWEGSVGLIGTRLWPSPSTGTDFWFAEAGASGQFQACWDDCDRHIGATWLGIDLAVPVYRHPGTVDAFDPVPLDPRTRLGLTLGSFFSVSRTWDFYATLSWIDRGDPDVPATQLPILDGGFDQIQLALGLIAHWSFDPPPPFQYKEPR
jgi:hypothetical protein